MSQSPTVPLTTTVRRPWCTATFFCLGHTSDGSECGIPMALCAPATGTIEPFYSAIAPSHEPGCDEGAWAMGEEAEAAVRAVQDGYSHPASQWVRAVQLACDLDEDYLAQWTTAQWQAWADLRNTLPLVRRGEIAVVAGVPTLALLPGYEPPTDLTLPFPYVGRLQTTVTGLLRAVTRSDGLVRIASRLFGGPTEPTLHEVHDRCQAASYQPTVDAYLLPQEDGKGLLAEITHIRVQADDPTTGALPNLTDLLGTNRACTCQQGTNQWRWA